MSVSSKTNKAKTNHFTKNEYLPPQLPYTTENSPHVIIEVNHHCNMRCRACYKTHQGTNKPLAMIIEEMDLAEKLRNLDLISFAGGEPTLHPDLPVMISEVKKRGYHASVLSNGTTLTQELLASYKNAGLDMIYAHIDSGQKRPEVSGKEVASEKELDPLRDNVFSRISKSGILGALSITLYRSSLQDFRDIINYVCSRPTVKGLLVTCYQDHTEMGTGVDHNRQSLDTAPVKTAFDMKFRREGFAWAGISDKSENVENSDIAAYIEEHFNLTPDLYLPSNRDLTRQKWMLYTPFIIHRPQNKYKILPPSKVFRKFIRYMMKSQNRFKNGSNTIFFRMSSFKTFWAVFLSGLFSGSIRYFFRMLKFLFSAFKPGSKLMMKDLVFQEGPTVSADGYLEYCNTCPDATLRDGDLIPICLADFVKPYEKEQ